MSMVSKISVIADATKQGSVSILDAFQIIQKDQPKIKVIFASYLSDLFKKNLGPNTLRHLMREEEECLERVRSYFARMNIPYDLKVIEVPPWKMILEEMQDEVSDLIILQGEFLKRWGKEEANCALCSEAISQLRCPILVINSSEDTPLTGESK
jgi:hypothetical protein